MTHLAIGAAARRTRIGHWRHRLKLWARNWRTRRALARLDPARLVDIGLSVAEARREARRPFWQG